MNLPPRALRPVLNFTTELLLCHLKCVSEGLCYNLSKVFYVSKNPAPLYQELDAHKLYAIAQCKGGKQNKSWILFFCYEVTYFDFKE